MAGALALETIAPIAGMASAEVTPIVHTRWRTEAEELRQSPRDAVHVGQQAFGDELVECRQGRGPMLQLDLTGS